MKNNIVICGYADVESIAVEISRNTGIDIDKITKAIEQIIDSDSLDKIQEINELSEKLKQ